MSEASFVMEMDDVLEAMMHEGLATLATADSTYAAQQHSGTAV